MSQSKAFSITESPQVIDLSELAAGDINSGSMSRKICDYFIEVQGNNAELTIKANSAFSGSTYKDIENGTIAIGGDFVAIDGAAFDSFEVTYAGTFPVSVNIVRNIR